MNPIFMGMGDASQAEFYRLHEALFKAANSLNCIQQARSPEELDEIQGHEDDLINIVGFICHKLLGINSYKYLRKEMDKKNEKAKI